MRARFNAYDTGSQSTAIHWQESSSVCQTITVSAPPSDTTAPIVTISGFSPTGSNGWFKTAPATGTVTATDPSNVTAINCIDSASGLTLGLLVGGGTTSASRTLSVSGEGTHNITCTATDGASTPNNGAGPGSSNTATIKIDTAAPGVIVTPDRTADHNGWYNASVVFDTTGSDATSGVLDANCTANQTYSTPDGTGLTVNGSCTDNAGNVGNGTSAAFDFDDTNPSVTVTPARPADHNGWYNAPVVFDTAGTDATSGVSDANCTANQTYSTPDGTGLTVSGSCTDDAGRCRKPA